VSECRFSLFKLLYFSVIKYRIVRYFALIFRSCIQFFPRIKSQFHMDNMTEVSNYFHLFWGL